MALLQISEPGESRAKQACTTGAVGIDLGTTNSLIAIVLADGKPHALAVDEGSTLLPSVVHYGAGGGPGSVVIGRPARRLAAGIRAERDAAMAEISRILRDAAASAADLARVAALLSRMRYYARYLDEVEGRAAEI